VRDQKEKITYNADDAASIPETFLLAYAAAAVMARAQN
jgi:hypothetical protein